MNKTELLNHLADHDLSVKNGHYNEAYHGFTWLIVSLDGLTQYGMITITNEKIEREMPNLASDLYCLIHDFMDRRYPRWFEGRRTFEPMQEKV